MVKKLYEILSEELGKEVELKGIKLQFDRFSAYHADMIYKEHHITMDKLEKALGENPFGAPLDIAYYLLTSESKLEVNNDIDVFKKAIGVNETDLTVVMDALISTMNEGAPDEKKSVAEAPKKLEKK